MNARSYTATSPSRMNALGLSPLNALTNSGNRSVRSWPFRLIRRTPCLSLIATSRQPSTFSSYTQPARWKGLAMSVGCIRVTVGRRGGATGPVYRRAPDSWAALAARGESRPGSHALRSSAPHAIAQVDCSGAETSRLKEFEIPSYGGSECRLSAADDHRVEKQVTFVDEIGFERKSCQLGAANEDVVLRFALELPSRLGIELPLDTRDACRSACQRS